MYRVYAFWLTSSSFAIVHRSTRAMARLGPEAWTLTKLGNDPAINLYRKHGMEIVKSRRVETGDHPHTELRLALPTSKVRPYGC